ncbi:MAG: carbohydrate kinase [Planctomycetota bacterium]|nr:MAG: carbohydrate kinase [Planctomycetota bacterium]
MSAARPVIFGEVLFDCFPGGESVLGGAPFNVAWHLQAFGLAPFFISRVGADALGETVLERMREHGMDISGVQVDAEHPTGSVQVSLDQGQPSYEILDVQAYDFIDAAAVELPERAALLYHGSLALRNPDSREAWRSLVVEADRRGVPCCVDINLRQPWWNKAWVRSFLLGATWLKLNEDELRELAAGDGEDIRQQAEEFRKAYGLEMLVLTLGAEGAICFTEGQDLLDVSPEAEAYVVDTVGAGDAFASVLLTGLLRGWPHETSLERAQAFALEICGQRGATVLDPYFYSRAMSDWTD